MHSAAVLAAAQDADCLQSGNHIKCSDSCFVYSRRASRENVPSRFVRRSQVIGGPPLQVCYDSCCGPQTNDAACRLWRSLKLHSLLQFLYPQRVQLGNQAIAQARLPMHCLFDSCIF